MTSAVSIWMIGLNQPTPAGLRSSLDIAGVFIYVRKNLHILIAGKKKEAALPIPAMTNRVPRTQNTKKAGLSEPFPLGLDGAVTPS